MKNFASSRSHHTKTLLFSDFRSQMPFGYKHITYVVKYHILTAEWWKTNPAVPIHTNSFVTYDPNTALSLSSVWWLSRKIVCWDYFDCLKEMFSGTVPHSNRKIAYTFGDWYHGITRIRIFIHTVCVHMRPIKISASLTSLNHIFSIPEHIRIWEN